MPLIPMSFIKRHARPMLGGAVLLALLVGGGFYFLKGKESADGWVTAKAVTSDIEDATTALGTLQPLNYVDVGTQVSGQLRRIAVELGDKVTEGQLLAEIDPTVLGSKVDAGQAQLQSLRASLNEKLAQQALADQQFQRQERMLKANATSQDAYQSALTAQKTARAQVAQLTANIRQVESSLKGDQANLSYTRIYAPMTGTVVSMPARQGQTLNANQQAPTILRVADLATMTVWTQVSEADIGRLKIGQDVYFTTLGAPGKRHYSKLRQILPTPEIVNNVVLYDALFDVPNDEGDLGIQMTAQVFFVHAQAKQAVVIPVSALAFAKDGKKTVLVMKDGKPVSREVTLGVRNRVQAEVISGLEAGDDIVVGKRATGEKPASANGSRRVGPPAGI